MKAYQYKYTNPETFAVQMATLRDELKDMAHSAVLFHAFAECWCNEEIHEIRQTIRDAIPEAMLVGTASFGNIMDGHFTREDIVITAMVFETPGTRVEAFCCPLDPSHPESSLRKFIARVESTPSAKAVEAFIMADVETMTRCCEALNALPENVAFFGGKSRFDHSPVAPKFVINDAGECIESAAVFVLYSGEALHVQTGMINGWNPLGRPMKVTKAHGDILCELDGRPAHELYYKYLHIKNDENFFFNTLEFPFLFYKDGSSVVRISHACLEDGSMVLGASIPENDYVRIAFGDSNEIMRSVLKGGKEFESFRPDALLLYSCGCRRTYWGDEASNKETMPFESLAPTSGFYTAGELLRDGGVITEHNSALIVAAIREGEASAKPPVAFGMNAEDIDQGESLINRLSSFVAAAIDELETAIHDLERLSITDGLTELLNRRETERRIRETLSAYDFSHGCGISLIMMDLDDFKQVNDCYGHHEGDHVLQVFAALLRECVEPFSGKAQAGRWGGEEFIVQLSDVDMNDTAALAEDIRRRFEACPFAVSGKHSVSIGVTRVHEDEDADAALSRVDAAMYKGKQQGKNRVFAL